MESPTRKRDRFDPGDVVQRRFRYQYGYGVVILVACLTKELDYTALWCEQHEDFLAEISDTLFDAYQIKSRKSELGPWKLNDKPFYQSVSRFVQLDNQFGLHIRRFKFVSNAEAFETKVEAQQHLCPIVVIEAVDAAVSTESLKDPAKKGLELLAEKAGVSLENLFAVLKRLDFVIGPTLQAFEAEIAQDHLGKLPLCSGMNPLTLAKIRDVLMGQVASASSLYSDEPRRHYSAITRNFESDPLLLAKRILVADVLLKLNETSTSDFQYPHSMLSLRLGYDAAKEMGATVEKMAQPDAPHEPLENSRILISRRTHPAPVLPPNLVHPYPLEANFTGRHAERQELTLWLTEDKYSIYELVAIGGMGKSALTWYWMTQDVLATTHNKFDGVMWWSFYHGESSFTKFVDEGLVYVNGQPPDAARLPTTYDRILELRRQLQSTRILLILDGFERQLRDYGSLNAAYQSDNAMDRSREARSCVDPNAGRLLREIAAGATRAKILLTTRLPVSDLEDRVGDVLSNVLKRDLERLAENDAIAFMRAQGVRKGTTSEIAGACAIYGNHPLSLRLLSGLIARDAKMPGDIAAAPRHDVHDNLIQRQHHVLEQSFDALRKRERALISRIAAFRGPMPFEALEKTLSNPAEGKRFEHALTDLQERGLLQRDLAHNRYDLHPIVRHYCYHRLKDKVGTHTRLRDYFAKVAIPVREQPQSIEDLQTAIELYHHTVCSGSYDTAWFLLSHHLATALHFQFGAYQVVIELVRALFPDGEDELPQLSDGKSKAWALAELANMYSVLGKSRHAIQLFSRGEKWTHTDESLANLLANLAGEQIRVGDLEAADQSLERSIELRGRYDTFSEALACTDSALLLTYRGEFAAAESRWKTAQAVFDRYGKNKTNYVSLVRARRSWLALFVGDARRALELAREARQLANGTACGEPDIIRADWLCGAALVREKNFDAAAGHLGDALTRCRRINMVYHEAELLLEWARWHRARGATDHALTQADEALNLANRCEYRLTQADIHNFLAVLALDDGKLKLARHHAEIAKEHAWCNGPPHSYKAALDEAEAMLKRLSDAENCPVKIIPC